MIERKYIQEENKKLRRLQLMIDLTVQLLYQTADLTLEEGISYIQNARIFALSMFPDKGDVFDLIYKPRMLRVLNERGVLKVSRN
ncbi:MAG: hypothetical protein P8184_13755 [Calditrichia bacterium]